MFGRDFIPDRGGNLTPKKETRNRNAVERCDCGFVAGRTVIKRLEENRWDPCQSQREQRPKASHVRAKSHHWWTEGSLPGADRFRSGLTNAEFAVCRVPHGCPKLRAGPQ